MRLRFFTTTWLRTLTLFGGLYGLALLYGYLNCYGDPGSYFYNDERAQTKKYSMYRMKQAAEFYSHPENVLNATKAGPNPRFCASVITSKRPDIQYLKTTVATALAGLTEAERHDIVFNVHFSHTDPREHPDFEDAWLNEVVDSAHSYNVPPPVFDRLKQMESFQAWRAIAVIDFTEELQRCYETGAEWIGMFEDDLVFADGWFANTIKGIQETEALAAQTPHEWLFLRLFDHEGTWMYESNKIGDHFELKTSLRLAIPLFILGAVLRFFTPLIRRHVDYLSLIIVCFFFIPGCVVLYYQYGLSSMQRPTSGVHKTDIGCCSQAWVFPRTQVPRVRATIRDREYGWIDELVTYVYDRTEIVDRYTLYPILVQDIGGESVRGSDRNREYHRFNTAFERLSPWSLKWKHWRLAKKLYS